jgi:hypothetical protein
LNKFDIRGLALKSLGTVGGSISSYGQYFKVGILIEKCLYHAAALFSGGPGDEDSQRHPMSEERKFEAVLNSWSAFLHARPDIYSEI